LCFQWVRQLHWILLLRCTVPYQHLLSCSKFSLPQCVPVLFWQRHQYACSSSCWIFRHKDVLWADGEPPALPPDSSEGTNPKTTHSHFLGDPELYRDIHFIRRSGEQLCIELLSLRFHLIFFVPTTPWTACTRIRIEWLAVCWSCPKMRRSSACCPEAETKSRIRRSGKPWKLFAWGDSSF